MECHKNMPRLSSHRCVSTGPSCRPYSYATCQQPFESGMASLNDSPKLRGKIQQAEFPPLIQSSQLLVGARQPSSTEQHTAARSLLEPPFFRCEGWTDLFNAPPTVGVGDLLSCPLFDEPSQFLHRAGVRIFVVESMLLVTTLIRRSCFCNCRRSRRSR